MKNRRDLSVDDYVQGILKGDRALLSMAITLIEGQNPEQQLKAQELIERILPHSGGSFRIGISGVPGAGKSTFIENYGHRLLEKKGQLAVLAVDPSSNKTGGSILGDKTRMEKLSQHPHSFIRPSPSVGNLGGVAQKTRESIFLCEAAGFDHVFVETVGVGQSETMVADMVDLFVVLLLPGAGDELQGIKRGILEMADLFIIHKADGTHRAPALRALQEYQMALHVLRGRDEEMPPVLACSSLTGDGYDELDKALEDFAAKKKSAGLWQKKRKAQQQQWMWELIESQLHNDLRHHPQVKNLLPEREREVGEGKITPQKAAREILQRFYSPSSPVPS